MNSSDHHLHDADSPSPPSLAPGAVAVPSHLRVARCVTRYASCTVDPRPGRAVHYPDLNACLVNEGRPEPVDCNTVHFGYAIPVSVVPLPEEPDLAELVLDPTPDLTPEAVSYLLRHHPQLRKENSIDQVSQDLNGSSNNLKMAATAKHEHLRSRDGNNFTAEPEEDIAAIAKQISDHAEAIYQTWKSRGLGPAEILTCHSNATAADKFGSALTPQPSPPSHPTKPSPAKSLQTKSSPVKTPTKPSVGKPAQQTVDLLASAPSLDANNLEQLVNNFVVEDKARLAAARQQKASPSKSLPSSIQFALQKFEKHTPDVQTSKASPTYVKSPGSSSTKSPSVSFSSQLSRTSAAPVTSTATQQITPNVKSPSAIHHGTVQLDTIEMTIPPDINPQPKRIIAVTSSDITSPSSTSSGLTTWPLKNKTVASGSVNSVTSATTGTAPNKKDDVTSPSAKYATLPSNKTSPNAKDAVAYLDEVAREEERLINALKTGIIIAEDPTKVKTSSSKITEKKTGSILHKKSTKDNKTTIAGKKAKKQPQTEIVTSKFPIKTITSSIDGQPTSPGSPTSTINSPPSFVPSPTTTDTESPLSQQIQTEVMSDSKDELDKNSLSNLSAVDYAKIRYRAAQQNPLTQQRLEDVKQFEHQRSVSGIVNASSESKHLLHNEVVPVARNRFQLTPRGANADGSTSPTSPGDNWRQDWLPGGKVGIDDELPNARRKVGSSPSSLVRTVRHPPVDPHGSHQETTGQQRLRTVGSSAGSGNNPVRPFLTRGSVAERVLIFEKCPSELLLDKRTRNPPAITTWRSGHDVHAKAQVGVNFY